MTRANLQILPDPNDLARAAAEQFLKQGIEAVGRKGQFTVVLSGGSTPKVLYELLADPTQPFREQLPWDKTHFFWTDERHVPPDHPDSNYRMAHEALFVHLPNSKNNVHRVQSENRDAQAAADEYEETLRAFFQLKAGGLPQFDLILLGLGLDGHTASIFPGSDVLQENRRLVTAPWVEKLQSYRITMTAPVLNNGVLVLFLVSGKEKSEILKAVLEGEVNPERYPAQVIRPAQGSLLWLADKAAGKRLDD